MKTLVIIPTYNEKENVLQIIRAVLQSTEVEILIVDDNSPDGTGALVESTIPNSNNRLHLLKRLGKEGLGRAYIAGFKWALERGYELIVEMDADFSHRPEDLKGILESANKADFVVGSRYVAGGKTVNWGFLRKLISRGGGIYSRVILGYPINDWTGGFNAWKAKVLNSIGLDKVTSNGYSFQIELKYKALKKGFKSIEHPISFEDRRVGKSKMSFRIVIEAFYKVWQIRFT